MPIRGDYEVVAKRTRLAGSHGYTRLVKKYHLSLTTELAKELTSPQRASEVARGATEIPALVVTNDKAAPIVAVFVASTHEVASNVAMPTAAIHEVAPDVAHADVISETISETVPTTSEPMLLL